jgi:beta-glucosidase|tara:strand:+ start:115 stop:405 length:291 start_codon:yes stop_codon:yes gene_type:complete
VLRNRGKRAGVETLQLYLGLPYPAGTTAPPLQLKGFAKTALGPGESTLVRFALTPRHRSTWDEKAHAWAEVSGRVEVVVGTSSRDDAALRGHFVVP